MQVCGSKQAVHTDFFPQFAGAFIWFMLLFFETKVKQRIFVSSSLESVA